MRIPLIFCINSLWKLYFAIFFIKNRGFYKIFITFAKYLQFETNINKPINK